MALVCKFTSLIPRPDSQDGGFVNVVTLFFFSQHYFVDNELIFVRRKQIFIISKLVSVEQEGVAAGTAISALSDFSAIKELDKITKEIEELGRLVYLVILIIL